jgi:2-polyprenyl-3-methyl-5-hydroxy-6-metoxy-1,4-benzoquinol methylase
MPGTFRDPSGSLIDADGRILRVIRGEEVPAFRALLASEVVKSLVARGALVATRSVEPADVPEWLRSVSGEWFEHDRVGFVSVPAEWSAAMLAHAALHTLDLNVELLRHGYILKDATPSNILFDGARPVFIDVPSIAPIRPGLNVWLARHQFETTFLLPLLAVLDAGYPLQCSLTDPARGMSHEQLAQMFGPRRWLTASRLRHVALAAALGGKGAAGKQVPPAISATGAADLEKTRFILSHSMKSLRKAIEKLLARIDQRRSHWKSYAGARAHYADVDLQLKRDFVGQVVQRAGAHWILDIGANTGEFSEMAAFAGANVVGIDIDEVSVSAIHANAQKSGKPIQALVMDLSQPTPAAGWRNSERKSFLERATGRFDLALMLAVGHHLRVTAGVPLEQIVETGLQLGGGSLLFEFVPTVDPMFAAIARGRESLYADNTVENCEALLGARGRIESKKLLPNGRTLFWVLPG